MALRFLIGSKSCFSPFSFILQNRSFSKSFSEEESASESHDAEIEEEIIFPYNVMNCLNEVRLIGRISAEPKETQILDQPPFVIAPLVTEHFYKTSFGSTTKSVVFHKVIFRNRELGNFVLNHLTKGSRVYILGGLVNIRFAGEDEASKTSVTCIRAEKLIPLSKLIRKKSTESEN